ncbi:MAG: peptidoglycan DD-metalloendopeptidase family protein, partial [Pseudomonadota bacterium]
AAAGRETAALAARASSLRELLRRLERFARSITPRVKPPRGAPAISPSRKPARRAFVPDLAFSKARGRVPRPVSGPLIGSFGTERPEGGRFEGVRYRTRDEAVVTAPFNADVIFARPWRPVSDLVVNLVVLDVGEGYHILFMGLGSFLVEAGQEVAAGEPIGMMQGKNARLDVEIRQGGDPVNPALWINDEARPADDDSVNRRATRTGFLTPDD